MKPIHYAFLFSLLFHLAVASYWWGHTVTPKELPPPPLVLRVVAHSVPVTAPLSRPQPEPVQKEQKAQKQKPKPKKALKPEPKPKPKKKVEAEVAKPMKPTDEAKTLDPVTEPQAMEIDSAVVGAAEADFRTAVRSAIEARKRYPMKARRMRQQGDVVVAFTILESGAIEGLHIVRSSGFNLLNQAALTLIVGLDGEFPIPPELHRREWFFELSIDYRLQ